MKYRARWGLPPDHLIPADGCVNFSDWARNCVKLPSPPLPTAAPQLPLQPPPPAKPTCIQYIALRLQPAHETSDPPPHTHIRHPPAYIALRLQLVQEFHHEAQQCTLAHPPRAYWDNQGGGGGCLSEAEPKMWGWISLAPMAAHHQAAAPHLLQQPLPQPLATPLRVTPGRTPDQRHSSTPPSGACGRPPARVGSAGGEVFVFGNWGGARSRRGLPCEWTRGGYFHSRGPGLWLMDPLSHR